MAKVTKESLAQRIVRMEEKKEFMCNLSLNEEYQVEAYRMLLAFMIGAVAADDLIRETRL